VGHGLALAYAQAHPERVTEIVLTAVTPTTSSEVEWATKQMRFIAGANQTQENSVGFLFDKTKPEEVLDLEPIDFFWSRPGGCPTPGTPLYF
jgi:pimeloyl-ACP methyl ester carboxylesterase